MTEPAATASPLPRAVEELGEQLRAGDRRALARAITLIESTREDHQQQGQELLERLVPRTGGSLRVGITGPPGVGKSSFIETLGLFLLEEGRRVAVLAVDPSSPRSGGSILGDKTRMERLAQQDRAFIRPSPSGGALGGVAHRTRETLLLCEAAGFDVVLVETVGVGQSEVAVRSIVDFFAVLLQPGAGDQLQGIKKGALELADALVVNKADGEQRAIAERTRADHAEALKLLRPSSSVWQPRVMTVSARTGEGVAAFWEAVEAHRRALDDSGELQRRRRAQARQWMWTLLEEGLRRAFRARPAVAARIPELEAAVEDQRITPGRAARTLLQIFQGS